MNTKEDVVKGFEEKGVLSPLQTKRNFTQSELIELQELQRIVGARKFEAVHIKGNTALVPNGQRVAEEYEAIARLMENVKNGWVAQKLAECGYKENEQCSINLSTGEVTPNDPKPK
jgi:hypothetical protein